MYTLAPAGVRRHIDDALIRRGDPGWADYLQWLASGAIPSPQPNAPPAPSPARVPEFVGPGQMMVALEGLGLLDDVEAWVSAQPRHVQLAWARASEFRRDSPLIALGATALGWDVALLDSIFMAAAFVII